MKLADTLTTLFSHHLWANLRLLEHCAKLTPDQLAVTISGTFGSIRDTWQHIVSAEQAYLYRIQTGQPRPRAEGETSPTLAEMTESIRATGSGLIEWAATVQADDQVEVDWHDDTKRQVPKTIFLTQAINHATEHRAQIMTLMTQLGVEPPSLDTWTYFEDTEA